MKPYYEEDGITIYHGDCREILPNLSGIGDLMLTDPPYGIALKNHDVEGLRSGNWHGIRGDENQTVGLFALDWAAIHNLPTIVFASPWQPWPGEWRNLIVWDKGGAVGGGGDIKTCLKRSWELIQVARNGEMRGSRLESVWRCSVTPQDTSQHIAAKPVRLILSLLVQFGGYCLVDPFCGTGTSLEAAQKLSREAIGIEIEERYCEIAAKRLAQGVLELND